MFLDEFTDDCLNGLIIFFCQESWNDAFGLFFGQGDEIQIEYFLGIFIPDSDFQFLFDQTSDQEETTDVFRTQLVYYEFEEKSHVSGFAFVAIHSLQNVQNRLEIVRLLSPWRDICSNIQKIEKKSRWKTHFFCLPNIPMIFPKQEIEHVLIEVSNFFLNIFFFNNPVHTGTNVLHFDVVSLRIKLFYELIHLL